MHNTVDAGLVITNQNQGLLLERCIRSALGQTFPGRFHEVVVADAASTDFSREVIESYGNRIVPVLLPAPVSPAQALWEGVKRASGRYIVHLRAQDFISDYMILFQAIWLYQNPAFDGVSVDTCLVEPGTDSKIKRVSIPEFPCYEGTMLRKEVFVKEGLYTSQPLDPSLESMHRGMREKYRIGHIPIPFYRYQLEATTSLHPSSALKEEPA